MLDFLSGRDNTKERSYLTIGFKKLKEELAVGIKKLEPKKRRGEMAKAIVDADKDTPKNRRLMQKISDEMYASPPKKPITGKCLVCGGKIIEKIVNEFVSYSPPIYGPGSKNQYANVSKGFYCTKCGIKYEHLPKKGVKRL